MKVLRKSLYMLTQEELEQQVLKECRAEGIPVKTDTYGNIWSIRFQDRPIFVAHMDTVAGNDSVYKIKVVEFNGKLYRPGNVLGADDRAGVNLILNHKRNINFILTKDEEVGCLGAKALEKNPDFIKDLEIGTFFIELDRRDGTDIIGYKHGYCEEGVVEAIQDVLPHYRDAYGLLTDIDAWTDLRQGVNLSVGYYDAHSTKEYLQIDEFEYLDSKIMELNNIVRPEFRTIYEAPPRQYNDIAFAYSKYFSTRPRRCDFCFTEEGTIYDYANYQVCEACAVGIPEEELFESGATNIEPAKLTDEDLSKCSNCKQTIFPGDKYVKVGDWEVIFCEECIEEKVMVWIDEDTEFKYGL